jgi:hypothetical protein
MGQCRILASRLSLTLTSGRSLEKKKGRHFSEARLNGRLPFVCRRLAEAS